METKEDKGTKEERVKLNARGTIITVFKEIMDKSPVFKSLYNKGEKSDTFELNYNPETVHLFIDYLSGYKIKEMEKLANICDYMGMQWESIKYTGKILTATLSEGEIYISTTSYLYRNAIVIITITQRNNDSNRYFIKLNNVDTRYKFGDIPIYDELYECKCNNTPSPFECKTISKDKYKSCLSTFRYKLLEARVFPIIHTIIDALMDK